MLTDKLDVGIRGVDPIYIYPVKSRVVTVGPTGCGESGGTAERKQEHKCNRLWLELPI